MRQRRPATKNEPVVEYEDIDEFVAGGSIPAGRFAVSYEGVPVDFYYAPVEGARATVVFFHGSTSKAVSLPMHAGTGLMKNIPANRLAISDPSIALDDTFELILSWYAGSAKQPRLSYFIETIIRRVQVLVGVPHLIFMGGSGGGMRRWKCLDVLRVRLLWR